MMGLDRGKLSRAEREKKTTRKTTRCLAEKLNTQCCKICLVCLIKWYLFFFFTWPILGKYVDKSGKARFVGDKVELKKSQNLACSYMHFFFENHVAMRVLKSLVFQHHPNHSQLGLRLAEGIS